MPVIELPDKSGDTLRVLEVDGYYLSLWPFATNQEEDFRSMPSWKARSDDVIVCAYPKAGTHWVWEIINMLYNGKADRIWANKEFVMFEFMAEKDYDAIPSPRIMNAHLLFNQLPADTINKRCKLVFVQRNPKDIAVSFYNHHQKLKLYNYDGKWANYLQLFLDGKVDSGSWFDYTLTWEKAIEEHPELPIHIVHYENLKKNGLVEIRRLAKFLGIEENEELFLSIHEMCEFSTMKKDKDKIEVLEASKENKPLFYRKGEIGDWKNWFTVAQNEQFDKEFEKRMSNSKFKSDFIQYH